mgnify:CR=1 FL=1
MKSTALRSIHRSVTIQALAYGTGDEVYSIVRSFEGTVRHQDIKFAGLVGMIQLRFDQTQDEYYEQFVEEIACHTCKGKRLKPEVLSMSVKEAIAFFDALELDEVKTVIAKEILKEIRARLRFLDTVGLDYLNLSRRAGTLSGGEAQRIRLATQIGSALIGVLYVLDEPSIGLHQRDNGRLIEALKTAAASGRAAAKKRPDHPKVLAKRLKQEKVPAAREAVSLVDAAGRVCAASVIPYPPGIPIVCPGEVFDEEVLLYIKSLREMREKVIGVSEDMKVMAGKRQTD